jgi:hypothetical protein
MSRPVPEYIIEERRKVASDAYWNVVQGSVWDLRNAFNRTWVGREDKYYLREQMFYQDCKHPINFGATVIVVIFAVLRVPKTHWFARNLLGVGLKTDRSNLIASLPHISFTMDAIAALSIGGVAGYLTLNDYDLNKSFSEAPLWHGKSNLYNTLCPRLVAVDDTIDQRVFEGRDLDPSENYLDMFKLFCENCKIRTAYIEERERLGVARPEIVPYPGLKGFPTRPTLVETRDIYERNMNGNKTRNK